MYGYFYDNNYVYMVYEVANSGNLFELIKSGYKFTEKEIAKIIAQIARGLIYLKKRNILHRDLKLENILVNKTENSHKIEYNIKITDFGCSCQYFNKKRSSLYGTAEYLSPEICLGKPYDFAIDTWALGIMCYELMCGQSPFSDKDNKSTVEKIKNYSDFKCITGPLVKKGINGEFIEMMKKILDKDPLKRIKIEDLLCLKWMTDNTNS